MPASDVAELEAFDQHVAPIWGADLTIMELLLLVTANGQRAKGKRPFKFGDLVPWSRINRLKARDVGDLTRDEFLELFKAETGNV